MKHYYQGIIQTWFVFLDDSFSTFWPKRPLAFCFALVFSAKLFLLEIITLQLSYLFERSLGMFIGVSSFFLTHSPQSAVYSIKDQRANRIIGINLTASHSIDVNMIQHPRAPSYTQTLFLLPKNHLFWRCFYMGLGCSRMFHVQIRGPLIPFLSSAMPSEEFQIPRKT